MKRLPVAFCCVAAITCFSQNQFAVSGYIKDAVNRQTQFGTSVFAIEASTGTTEQIVLNLTLFHSNYDYGSPIAQNELRPKLWKSKGQD